MRLCWSLLAATLLLETTTWGLKPPRSFYRRTYYSSVAPPGPIRLLHKAPPPSYTRADLQTNESKRRDVSKKYPKKTHYRPFGSEEDEYSGERYNSAEYSNESTQNVYTSHEQDSREYTIGTQIRVQHPITVPKKATSSYANYPKHQHSKYVTASPYKGSGAAYLSNTQLGSAEEQPLEPQKRHKYTEVRYEPDPFHLVPPPKTTLASSSNSYSVFEPEHDDYEVVPSAAPRGKSYERYKNVASKKQIEAFLEDQQKLLDEAIKLQLLHNPKLQKFIKTKVNEPRPDVDIEDFETYPPSYNSGPVRNSYSGEHTLPPKSTRARRRPPTAAGDSKRAPNPKHLIKPKRKYRSTALVINV